MTPGGEVHEDNYKPMLCIQSEAKLLLKKPMSHDMKCLLLNSYCLYCRAFS